MDQISVVQMNRLVFLISIATTTTAIDLRAIDCTLHVLDLDHLLSTTLAVTVKARLSLAFAELLLLCAHRN